MESPLNFEDFERKRRLFLTEWEVGVLPQDEEARLALETGVSFAKMVLQVGLTLNGGAFVLIPAYVALLPNTNAGDQLVHMLISFGFGLTAMFLASVLAFFTMQMQQSAIREKRESVAKLVHNSFNAYIGLPKADSPEAIAKLETGSETYWKYGRRLQIAAITSAFASFAAFLVGGVLAIRIMIA